LQDTKHFSAELLQATVAGRELSPSADIADEHDQRADEKKQNSQDINDGREGEQPLFGGL
jgi:hypothetical protein